ncbi:D-alanyl-D-alanine carboxypeptidase family protein [Paenibacillus eucommiae]|uniref:serine-type D-Ala-D-Ala carboxypeptidase n=1 Tax=Paenibacillus eucommiae TaxID=1355755 RepID=A0ABS4IY43_9BACL|nr:D-alanyl-D-alanine carboxypeptidase family protein [Paenibacillus eucommiae]MBP1992492.1 D-alanyl-D-alanine carboxypeptidase (penicillin-binding protein 5/6) [Paenibacillus eucommiae]
MKKFVSFKRKMAWILGVCLLAQTVLFHINPTSVNAIAGEADLKLDVKSAILMEASTGQVIYEYNADEPLPPASMTKMMTEYLTLEAIKDGKLNWDDIVTASKNAAEVTGSGQLIAENEKLTVKQMFSAMSIYSANDASVALAERLGGTEEKFVQMMNDKARELGLSDQAHFIDPTGLSRADLKNVAPSIQGETLMSARDSAKLAYNIIKDHKEVLEFTKIPAQKLRERDKDPMINWNYMLEGNANSSGLKMYAYPGLDGLKTGSTDDAGYCFTGTVERDGMRLISVVMGTVGKITKRFDETRKLLDYGFTNYEIKTVLNADTEIESLKLVNIKKGVQTKVSLVTGGNMTFVVKKGTKDEEFNITAEQVEESKLVAPIEKGAKLGTVKVTYDGNEKTIDLVAKDEVEKAGMFRLFFRGIKNFFTDMFQGIKDMF